MPLSPFQAHHIDARKGWGEYVSFMVKLRRRDIEEGQATISRARQLLARRDPSNVETDHN